LAWDKAAISRVAVESDKMRKPKLSSTGITAKANMQKVKSPKMIPKAKQSSFQLTLKGRMQKRLGTTTESFPFKIDVKPRKPRRVVSEKKKISTWTCKMKKESVCTNGFGYNLRGATKKLVETQAEKKAFRENNSQQSSMVLYNLANMWSKKRPSHFYDDATHTMTIICYEFQYSLQHYIGMRWFNLSWAKGAKGFRIQYERSVTHLDKYLKKNRRAGTSYKNMSALIDKLFAELSQPTILGNFNLGLKKWMGRRILNPDTFKAKINQMTEYIHLAYIVLHTVFPDMEGITTPVEQFLFLQEIFGDCKDRKSMASILYDFAVVYDSFHAIGSCQLRLELYRTNPCIIADNLHSRAVGNDIDAVLLDLEKKIRKVLAKPDSRCNKSGSEQSESWLIARYRICVGYRQFVKKKPKTNLEQKKNDSKSDVWVSEDDDEKDDDEEDDEDDDEEDDEDDDEEDDEDDESDLNKDHDETKLNTNNDDGKETTPASRKGRLGRQPGKQPSPPTKRPARHVKKKYNCLPPAKKAPKKRLVKSKVLPPVRKPPKKRPVELVKRPARSAPKQKPPLTHERKPPKKRPVESFWDDDRSTPENIDDDSKLDGKNKTLPVTDVEVLIDSDEGSDVESLTDLVIQTPPPVTKAPMKNPTIPSPALTLPITGIAEESDVESLTETSGEKSDSDEESDVESLTDQVIQTPLPVTKAPMKNPTKPSPALTLPITGIAEENDVESLTEPSGEESDVESLTEEAQHHPLQATKPPKKRPVGRLLQQSSEDGDDQQNSSLAEGRPVLREEDVTLHLFENEIPLCEDNILQSKTSYLNRNEFSGCANPHIFEVQPTPLVRDLVDSVVPLSQQWVNTIMSMHTTYADRREMGVFQVNGNIPNKEYYSSIEERFENMSWARMEDVHRFNPTLYCTKPDYTLLFRCAPVEMYVALNLKDCSHRFDSVARAEGDLSFNVSTASRNTKTVSFEGFAACRVHCDYFQKYFDEVTVDFGRLMKFVLQAESQQDIIRDGPAEESSFSTRLDFGMAGLAFERKESRDDRGRPKVLVCGQEYFEKHPDNEEIRKDLGQLVDAGTKIMETLQQNHRNHLQYRFFSNEARFNMYGLALQKYLKASVCRAEWVTIQIKCLNRGDKTAAHYDAKNCEWEGYNVTGALSFVFRDSFGTFWSLKIILNSRKVIGDFFIPNFRALYCAMNRQLEAIEQEYSHLADHSYNGHWPPLIKRLSARNFRSMFLNDNMPWKTEDLCHGSGKKPINADCFTLIAAPQRDLFLSLLVSAIRFSTSKWKLSLNEQLKFVIIFSYQNSWKRTFYVMNKYMPRNPYEYYKRMIQVFGTFLGGTDIRFSASGMKVENLLLVGTEADQTFDRVVKELQQLFAWVNAHSMEEDIDVDPRRSVTTTAGLRERVATTCQGLEPKVQIKEFRLLFIMQICALAGIGLEEHPILTKLVFVAKNTGGYNFLYPTKRHAKPPQYAVSVDEVMSTLGIALQIPQNDVGNAMEGLACES
jgi:hypothetical protein